MKGKTELQVVACHDLPENPDSNTIYRLLPKNEDDGYYRERTDRNIGWITWEEQEMLRNSVVGIAGCGGMGAQLAEKFLRLGIGEIRIADIEVFDVSNINRQFAATRFTVGKSKAFETAKMLRGITDDFTLVVYPQGIVPETVDHFLDCCDVVCDEIEFWAVGARILLHQRSRAHGISVLNCNTIGFSTRLFFFTPSSETMEECLGLTYEEALALQEKVQSKKGTPEEIRRVMESVMNGLLPEFPEYCERGQNFQNHRVSRERLIQEGKGAIIATNPPMATGFLANHVLLYLLRDSDIKRDVVQPPEMPGYLYFDAAKMEAKIVKNTPVVISLVEKDSEREEAIAFMNAIASERYRCAPPPPPEIIFVAKRDDEIVGVMALEFGDEQGVFPLEKIYKFDYRVTPWPFVRNEVAQFGRWMAKVRGISIALMYAATLYAIHQGKVYGLTEVKPYILKHTREIGIELREIPGATLVPGNIPESGKPYYLAPPPPKLYMVNLRQKEQALRDETIKAVREGRIILEDTR